MHKETEKIINYIKTILCAPKIPEEMPEELQSADGMDQIDSTLREVRKAIRELSLGNLSEKIQGSGFTVGSLKSLQSTLKSLVWQAKTISRGDFTQRTEFLGEFSDTFNIMTENLEASFLAEKEAKDILWLFYETIPDATVVISKEDLTLFSWNPALVAMTNYEENQMSGKKIGEIIDFKNDEYKNAFFSVVKQGGKFRDLLVEMVTQSGKETFGLISADELFIKGRPFLLLAIKDITEMKMLEHKLRESEKMHKKLSETDALTGLNNRMKLDSVLKMEIARLSRTDSVCSIMLLDIDYFKMINDTYGHLIGDEVLIDVAKIIKDNTRKIDTAGRWGGEEFMVVMPFTGIDGAVKLAEKLRVKISEHNFYGVGHLTASFGVAESKGNINELELVLHADSAMYSAKEGGRNLVCAYYQDAEIGY